MSVVTNESLKKHGWSDLALRAYQLDGVNWLLKCYSHDHGCILGDEMGLGKTCQTIAMLAWLTSTSGDKRPHLVICPRSVLENWAEEFKRFSPGLKVISYVGDKETRAELVNTIKKSKQGQTYCFDVLITTYEVCLKDSLFLQSLFWHVLVVDEAHRLKNCESLLYQTLEKWDFHCGVLLTGTPVQNNLQELFSLLAFIDRCKFKPRHVDTFVEKYSHAHGNEIEELHELLKPYLLRRKKENVLKDLPERSDVVLYHGLSALQKKLYKAILTKDLDAFENPNTGQVHLMNILMQLRKCVNHPYLFDGVEPEPFELGEHLVEASAKLMLIDRLLKWLNALGHKVLIFSQMTHMLDVLQDYLGYRGFTYERLDGSVRGEERFLAVQNFNQNDETFVFLLSTKAGGQGLNLTAADTVIFVDSDFNPQNDLQAASRAHRIGQNRPVRVIRLIGKNTVEQIILNRAEEKLKLTDKVIESGEFSAAGMSVSKPAFVKNSKQLQDILKFGVEKLLSDDTPDENIEFSRILGPTVNGEWQTTEDTGIIQDAEEEKSSKEEAPKNIYMFEGHDYSKETSAGDIEAFEALIKLEKTSQRESASSERLLRGKGTAFLADLLPELSRKPRKQLTLEEQETQRKKHKEAAEKRAKKLSEQKEKKREELWKKHNYTSVNIMIESEDEDEEEVAEEEGSEEDVDQPRRSIHYVMGDVTHPLDAGTSDRIVVHCADDSGYWGRGGLFSAISTRSLKPQAQYELAGKVNDLKLGDCHLISLDDDKEKDDGQDMLALIVAQTRDRNNRLSGIKLMALKEGLEKVYFKAKQLKVAKVVEGKVKNSNSEADSSIQVQKASGSVNNGSSTSSMAPSALPELFTGVAIHLYNMDPETMTKYKRYIIAYPCCSVIRIFSLFM
ncbi:hypothetical protein C0Q70_04989 [Pomacea canaliculata]|uniref:Helicase ATP-binding domain-containing protein n=1 Tax=Pomacea canaliculata TaxID=400727 RepID=A0A2T7PJW8_POMCA|nr:hypothetical protein C0Q70_04989 [Pomacea canaliculata]